MKIEPDLLTLSRDGAIPHVCLATGQIVAEVAREGETIREFVDRTGWEDGPPIVVYEIDDDGKRIARLRAEWHRPIDAPRTVFVSAPLGGGVRGGGSQVLSIVAMIALMVVGNIAGGAIAGALELGATAAKILGKDERLIPCDVARLNQRLFKQAPAVVGKSRTRFGNVVSLLRAVLRRLALHAIALAIRPHRR